MSEAPAPIRLRIRRTHQAGETGNRADGIETFSVAVAERKTLLDALEEIKGRHDRTLQYRHSCHHGSCGTCGVLLDGRPVLACLTPLCDVADGALVEPQSPFPVIADLAVDSSTLVVRYPDAFAPLRPSEANRDAVIPAEVAGGAFVRFEDCIECGLCVSACPAPPPFVGPSVLAAYGRAIETDPASARLLLRDVDGEAGVWGCRRALDCSRVCPTGVYPAKHIAVMRRSIEKEAAIDIGKAADTRPASRTDATTRPAAQSPGERRSESPAP